MALLEFKLFDVLCVVLRDYWTQFDIIAYTQLYTELRCCKIGRQSLVNFTRPRVSEKVCAGSLTVIGRMDLEVHPEEKVATGAYALQPRIGAVELDNTRVSLQTAMNCLSFTRLSSSLSVLTCSVAPCFVRVMERALAPVPTGSIAFEGSRVSYPAAESACGMMYCVLFAFG